MTSRSPARAPTAVASETDTTFRDSAISVDPIPCAVKSVKSPVASKCFEDKVESEVSDDGVTSRLPSTATIQSPALAISTRRVGRERSEEERARRGSGTSNASSASDFLSSASHAPVPPVPSVPARITANGLSHTHNHQHRNAAKKQHNRPKQAEDGTSHMDITTPWIGSENSHYKPSKPLYATDLRYLPRTITENDTELPVRLKAIVAEAKVPSSLPASKGPLEFLKPSTSPSEAKSFTTFRGEPSTTLASLYLVAGLPKDPNNWSLAEHDTEPAHIENAVPRWFKAEVLGNMVSGGGGAPLAALDGGTPVKSGIKKTFTSEKVTGRGTTRDERSDSRMSTIQEQPILNKEEITRIQAKAMKVR